MAQDDVDDIFKDFEHKVEGKKEQEHSEKKEAHKNTESLENPEKKLSVEENLRRKYEKAEQTIKNKYKIL